MYTWDKAIFYKLTKRNCEKMKRKTQTNKTQTYNISEHKIHKIANKHYYKTVICCNASSLTLWSSKINLDRLFTTLTFLDDMNETNLLIEGHDICRY